jgi:hypothetical protein
MLRGLPNAKARLFCGSRRGRDTIPVVMSRFFRAAMCFALGPLLGGCARGAVPPDLPGMAVAAATPEDVLVLRAHRGHRGDRSLQIPDGDACLSLLESEKVRFHPIAPRPGMVTPVDVTGPIGGVRYETAGTTSLVCDCRLAVALDWLAPELLSFGIAEVHHSGAYVYRTTHNGHPSLHALGLAIDVHRVRSGSRRLDVSRDYARGEGPSCDEGAPVLNRLACELSRTGLFEQVITPDDDSDHRDHIHMAIRPL